MKMLNKMFVILALVLASNVALAGLSEDNYRDCLEISDDVEVCEQVFYASCEAEGANSTFSGGDCTLPNDDVVEATTSADALIALAAKVKVATQGCAWYSVESEALVIDNVAVVEPGKYLTDDNEIIDRVLLRHTGDLNFLILEYIDDGIKYDVR